MGDIVITNNAHLRVGVFSLRSMTGVEEGVKEADPMRFVQLRKCNRQRNNNLLLQKL